MGVGSISSGDPSTKAPATLLVACDFDHTLIDVNSDLVLFRDLPYGKALLPRFASLRQEQGMAWTQIMQSQLAELAQSEGYSKQDVLKCLHSVKMDPVLITAFRALHSSQDPSIKVIIASDANTIFIDEILKANGVEEGTFDMVYTNPGSWIEGDAIQVEPYQTISSPHDCPRTCPANMCKSGILQRARKELNLDQVEDLQIVYAGDGGNDYCPSLSLSESDLVLVREGLALHKLIENAKAITKENAGSETDKPIAKQVVAQQRLWKTQRELGEIFLHLLPQPQLAGKTSVNKDAVDVIAQGIEKGLKL
ncbi:hypothetical protein LTR84_009017 [Exophiala bonariae]|uniref:Uncharacterized protein n=1 Tax=Exophiala bonariae TaxID=1690606 RepID=A0AAV9MY32_9EURO|nr:hypothetical protein LTR84_009017 [Exophiala bonariae]